MDNSYEIRISAKNRQRRYWRDLWQYRELFYFLAWRDILVRYKQAVFGILWALIRPFLNIVIFTFIFKKVAHLDSGNVPYIVFVLAGMLPWQLFSSGLSEASNSLITNSNMVSKIYFPRLLVPASAIGVNLLDFLVSLGMLFAFLLWYHLSPSLNLFCLPFFVLLSIVFCLGAGFWLSALTVKYRDFRYVVPFFIQLGIYISPVGYASSAVPANYQHLFCLNPMVGIIDGFRWSLFGTAIADPLWDLSLASLVSVIFLATGFLYFRRTERSFADVI